MTRCRCVGELRKAVLTHDSPSFPNQPRTDAQKRGILYEKKARARLEEQYEHEFIPNPWFWYREKRRRRGHYCQPDGLIIRPQSRKIIIVEIKLRHTQDAYYQLRELYLPVVQHVFGPEWRYGTIEVVRWYDPAEPTPEPARLCKEPHVVNPGVFGVHICRA